MASFVAILREVRLTAATCSVGAGTVRLWSVLFAALVVAALGLWAAVPAGAAVGDLTYRGCISGETDSSGCTPTDGATSDGEYSGLNYLLSVAASSDGKSVYVASRYDSAVARFDRDVTTGELTYRGCTTGDEESGGSTGPGAGPGPLAAHASGACAEIETATDEGTDSGIDSLRSVALSPDATSLYVVSGGDDAVAHFQRNSSGALTYGGCITGRLQSGPAPDGTGACSAIPSATAGGSNSGLNNLQSVTVSGDGKSLYAASFGDDAVATFQRDAGSGELTYAGCGSGKMEAVSCERIAGATAEGENSGLDRAHSLAVSPDMTSVYVASQRDDAVSRFSRDTATGELSYDGCISGETESTACDQIAAASSAGIDSGLDNPFSLAVSPDSRSVYVAARDDDAVARFVRDSDSGGLTYAGCITGELPTAGACEQLATATADGFDSGLDSPRSVVVSSDDDSVYAASRGDDAVSHFTRNPSSGALAYQRCVTSAEERSGPLGSGACEAIPGATSDGANSGLDSMFELALSPDASSLYVASRYDAAVATFDRETLASQPADPGPGATLDTTGPGLTLGGRKKQRGSRVVRVKVTCGEACTAAGSGKIKVPVVSGPARVAASKTFKLKPRTKEIAARERATLKLRLGRNAKALVKRAQQSGRKATARIAVTAADAAGNEDSAKRRFTLRK